METLQEIVDSWNHEANKLLEHYQKIRKSETAIASIVLAKHLMISACITRIQHYMLNQETLKKC